jgi:hypothetical protein
MEPLEAHGRLMLRSQADRETLLPYHIRLDPEGDAAAVDGWPAMATALADVSGWLEDATTDEELDEAVRHGLTLAEGGVVTVEHVMDRMLGTIAAVVAWGQQAEAELEGGAWLNN